MSSADHVRASLTCCHRSVSAYSLHYTLSRRSGWPWAGSRLPALPGAGTSPRTVFPSWERILLSDEIAFPGLQSKAAMSLSLCFSFSNQDLSSAPQEINLIYFVLHPLFPTGLGDLGRHLCAESGCSELHAVPSGGGCDRHSTLPGRLKTTTLLLLHCLQACKAWTWDRAETVAKGNNRFLFIAWSALPLTLREPLHLQGVLPAGQRQVVPCAGGIQSSS